MQGYNVAHEMRRSGRRSSIATKILLVVTVTLTAGLVIVAGAALYLEKQALVSLQSENSLNFANLMGDDLREQMLAGDLKKLDAHIKKVLDNKRAVALSIFDNQGEERGTAKGDPLIAGIIKSGKPVSSSKVVNGSHVLETVLPLHNEERCSQCHDKEMKVLGAVKLTTSIERGYEANKEAMFWLVLASLSTLATCVVGLLVLIRRTVTRNLKELVTKVTDLARGEGDLTRLVTIDSNDEFAQLGEEINTLVGKIRDIIGLIAQTSEKVACSALQLRSNVEQMTTGAEEVAAQAATVATAGEEMSATSGDIAQNCLYASEGSQLASAAAVDGARVVNETITVMNSIADRVSNSARAVESLGERSDHIGEIVGTIEDIADQTNLLALNAAIEAARAGEQGRGFAVVADEVRALAERTARATREIGEMIRAIQQETKGAVSAMEEGVKEVSRGSEKAADSGRALEQILTKINDVNSQIHQVATAAEEQTATTSEISSNMMQITEVVAKSAEVARESFSTTNELSVWADDLRRIVGQFKLV